MAELRDEILKKLAVAHERVTEGRKVEARLRETVADLKRDGWDTRDAQSYLDSFERLIAQFEQEYRELQRELEAAANSN